ncbi:hypothetical protein Clacol_001311 [Clathrus columnatus]|uniref:Methyltransferase domain-containing protein n=1 Tax=Clathrus columnatus TaxID=1419009 RepID=A0AAV4ZY03_9AGAM|nr:hypothetical protein Clacol_001311 [Clathrus columnatus]
MSENTAYPLPAADRYAQEQDRLARQFQAIQNFIGDFTFAPINDLNVKAILELGSGTGAWASEAADRFPEADIIAVDIVEPDSKLAKPNVRFQKFDLRQPLPWEPESFDVVPNGEDVLLRILPLVRMHGILILEDTLAPVYRDPKLVPAFVKFWDAFGKMAKDRGINLELPRSYHDIISNSSLFDEITVKVHFCTFSEGDDTPIGQISAFSRESFRQGPLRHYPGTTPELIKQVEEEMDNPIINKTMGYDWYFVWARRVRKDSKESVEVTTTA